jgi:hypothetical protein
MHGSSRSCCTILKAFRIMAVVQPIAVLLFFSCLYQGISKLAQLIELRLADSGYRIEEEQLPCHQ